MNFIFTGRNRERWVLSILFWLALLIYLETYYGVTGGLHEVHSTIRYLDKLTTIFVCGLEYGRFSVQRTS